MILEYKLSAHFQMKASFSIDCNDNFYLDYRLMEKQRSHCD